MTAGGSGSGRLTGTVVGFAGGGVGMAAGFLKYSFRFSLRSLRIVTTMNLKTPNEIKPVMA
jgi:hypothetical protein